MFVLQTDGVVVIALVLPASLLAAWPVARVDPLVPLRSRGVRGTIGM